MASQQEIKWIEYERDTVIQQNKYHTQRFKFLEQKEDEEKKLLTQGKIEAFDQVLKYLKKG